MTPLRFRAWHKKKNFMFDCDAIFKGGVGHWHHGEKGHDKEKTKEHYNFDHVEVMQSTGLTDKNGKEIFEGDILQEQGDSQRIGIVEWRKSDYGQGHLYCLKQIKEYLHSADDYYGGFNEGDYEIIGNIYENLELLQ